MNDMASCTERVHYRSKDIKRYAVGLTGDQKLKYGIVITDFGTGTGRVAKELGYYETVDEAQTVLDEYAKIMNMQIWCILI